MTSVLNLCLWVTSSFCPQDLSELPYVNLFEQREGVTELTGRLIAKPQKEGDSYAAAMVFVSPWLMTHYAELGYCTLRVPDDWEDLKFAESLYVSGLFEFVIPDLLFYPSATHPNDPLYANQWHHAHIRTPQAWDLIQDTSSVTIAIVDSGVDPLHPDLMNLLVPGYNSVTNLPEIQGGDTSDVAINAHGTTVAGAAVAEGNNGIGVAGVCWNAALMPIRVTNNNLGAATGSEINEGALWAAQNGARVVNISYNGVQGNPAIDATAQVMRDTYDSLVVYIAGNAGIDLGNFDYPHVIVVGGSDQSDQKWSGSNYGEPVDCVAPSIDVWATAKNLGYAPHAGTSFAGPLVAGVLALMTAANPYLGPQELESRLYASCVDIGAAGEDSIHGHGRVDAFDALQAVLEGSLQLTVDPMIGGQVGTCHFNNAHPQEVVFIAYSFQGLGISHSGSLTVTSGLQNAVLFGMTSSDAAGQGNLSGWVPAVLRGRPVWIQALQRGGANSNVVATTIQ